jgi:hypothetical protein
MNKKKLEAMATTYLRAAFASALALYMAGETSPKALLAVAVAAVAGPVLKALDPKATEFGRVTK